MVGEIMSPCNKSASCVSYCCPLFPVKKDCALALIKDWTLRLLWPKEVDMQYLGMWSLLKKPWAGYHFSVSLNALKLLHRVGLVCTEQLLTALFASPEWFWFSPVPLFSPHLRHSCSKVLWETAWTYPGEVRRWEKEDVFPCSCLFLVVYSPRHLLFPVEFVWSSFSHGFILLFETFERMLIF